ncbi:hypothetical protein HPB50_017174 [Hyalomma asiaticum]|uniref:Uncharacterized protein n=1 Tax=Hyalomma asiaticum TaxID=266040 RepID=A0ACB7TP47_HYAAI|nr:hypothetical protein HPB50_017174 [Hyalomma asiaticum]
MYTTRNADIEKRERDNFLGVHIKEDIAWVWTLVPRCATTFFDSSSDATSTRTLCERCAGWRICAEREDHDSRGACGTGSPSEKGCRIACATPWRHEPQTKRKIESSSLIPAAVGHAPLIFARRHDGRVVSGAHRLIHESRVTRVTRDGTHRGPLQMAHWAD